MLNEKRILAVVPARGGSKGIHKKNLRTVFGIPLVVRAAISALSTDILDRRIISTDDPEIAQIAVNAGLDAPFLRPKRLSGDRISDLQVLTHSLTELERIDGVSYDIIVMLQPTSPMRSAKDVHSAVKLLVEGGFDSVWSVSLSDSKYHPLKQLVLSDGKLTYWDKTGSQIIARQQLTPTYHRNGVVYAITRECILSKNSIMGENCGAILSQGHHISIDTEEDIELLEILHQSQPARHS